jgi:hydroxymethylpyrimidine/phosphomethylpyrimidine kinase
MSAGTRRQYATPRIRTRNLPGTGCTLSSAIASYLALGHTLPQAVAMAKDYITSAIQRSVDIHIGSGNGPLV